MGLPFRDRILWIFVLASHLHCVVTSTMISVENYNQIRVLQYNIKKYIIIVQGT